MKEQSTAIVLAAGQGKRMQSRVQKQYLELLGHPVLYYSLKSFQDSEVDRIILVTGEGEASYCKEQIVERYGFTKVAHIVPGGKERYHSVYEGLKAAGDTDYVLIHDGARPLLTGEIITRTLEGARQWGAAVAAMPVKDTIKLSDEHGFVLETPQRSRVWSIQTPQAFSFHLILDAYRQLMDQEAEGKAPSCEKTKIAVTDDAMVLELMSDHRIRLVEGSYENIKITTPSDLEIAGKFLKNTIDRAIQ